MESIPEQASTRNMNSNCLTSNGARNTPPPVGSSTSLTMLNGHLSRQSQLVLNNQSTVVQPLLTDLYQLSMAYAYWKAGKAEDTAVFDLYFRKNPFQGEFTIFAGLEDCLKFLQEFSYSKCDIEYLQSVFPPNTDPKFFDYLSELNAKDLVLAAIPEGSVVFPRVPLIRIEGPLPVVQLLETTLLCLVNFASLVTTNAARFRNAAGPNKTLLEFGLRRAQGPDGGLTASKYTYIGGFDATSNVLAGKLYGVPVKGTHAHAFVNSFKTVSEVRDHILPHRNTSAPIDFVELAKRHLIAVSEILGTNPSTPNESEMAAFVAYAMAFPDDFLALIDTYDVEQSGIVNFSAVALALHDCGFTARGVRIDSGDLAYLSLASRAVFEKIADSRRDASGSDAEFGWMRKLIIVASNDINEDTLISLKQQQHAIDAYGIGTHLVTCQKQPALGCVFKLVECNGEPRMKLSQVADKVTLPFKKNVYRLYSHRGYPIVDLMIHPDESPPLPFKRVLCRHPFQETKRAYVEPAKVEPLLQEFWRDGHLIAGETGQLPTIKEIRDRAMTQIDGIRDDHKRDLNPTPYKVSISDRLYNELHNLWLVNAPIGELS